MVFWERLKGCHPSAKYTRSGASGSWRTDLVLLGRLLGSARSVLMPSLNQFGSKDDVSRILDLQAKVDRSWYFPRLYTSVYSKRFRERLNEYNEYKEIMRNLYFSVAKMTGRDVFVESSKKPTGSCIDIKPDPSVNEALLRQRTGY
jgi:hypothetical protein